ncbi:retrovirus-related pol polyprotein from transposon TNT 1-94 [Tanacetum coccineum]
MLEEVRFLPKVVFDVREEFILLLLGIPAKMSIRGLRLHHRSEVDMFSLSFADPFGINGLVECYLKKTPEVAPIACHKSIELILKIMIEADDFWLRSYGLSSPVKLGVRLCLRKLISLIVVFIEENTTAVAFELLAKHWLEIHFHVERKLGFLRGKKKVLSKRLGKESANESGLKFIPFLDIQPCLAVPVSDRGNSHQVDGFQFQIVMRETNESEALSIAILGKTPYELLRGRKPTLDYFRVFESYSQNSKAYIILNKHTRKVEESLNVTFNENPPPSNTSPLVDDDLDEEEAIKVTEKKNLENDIEDETLEIDEIVNIKESRNHPLENVIGNLNQRTLRSQAQNQSNFFCFISTVEPKNLNEALTDESWIVAMQEELNQFIANDVWELVPQPRNMNIKGN